MHVETLKYLNKKIADVQSAISVQAHVGSDNTERELVEKLIILSNAISDTVNRYRVEIQKTLDL